MRRTAHRWGWTAVLWAFSEWDQPKCYGVRTANKDVLHLTRIVRQTSAKDLLLSVDRNN